MDGKYLFVIFIERGYAVGAAFVVFNSSEEAQKAIDLFHEKKTLAPVSDSCCYKGYSVHEGDTNLLRFFLPFDYLTYGYQVQIPTQILVQI